MKPAQKEGASIPCFLTSYHVVPIAFRYEIAMTYTLHRLAAGSYDLALDDALMGSVVLEISSGGQMEGWRVELLDDLPEVLRPHPFTQTEHHFDTLEAAQAWLGGAPVIEGD